MDGGDGGLEMEPFIRSVNHASNRMGVVCLVLDGIAGMVTLHCRMGWNFVWIMPSFFSRLMIRNSGIVDYFASVRGECYSELDAMLLVA